MREALRLAHLRRCGVDGAQAQVAIGEATRLPKRP
jgi:hypothetical protein